MTYRATTITCPQCRIPLRPARSAMACPTCRGLWIEEAVLDEMLRQLTGRTTPPTFVAIDGPAGPPCSMCSTALRPVTLHDVQVARCSTRHGVWFATASLQTVLHRAAEDRGSRPSVLARIRAWLMDPGT